MRNSGTKYWVYILECSDGTYYTGITTDVQQRVETHNLRKGAKYTAPRLPVILIYSEMHPDRSSAAKRELEVKKLTRAEKEILVKSRKGK